MDHGLGLDVALTGRFGGTVGPAFGEICISTAHYVLSGGWSSDLRAAGGLDKLLRCKSKPWATSPALQGRGHQLDSLLCQLQVNEQLERANT